MFAAMTWVLERLGALSRWQKQAMVFAIDLILCIQAIWIAYSLRIGVWVFWDIAVQQITVIALALMIPIFWLTGVYRAIFRYAGLGMMRTMMRAFVFYSIGMVGLITLWTFPGIPRTVGVIQPIIFLIMVCLARMSARYLMVDVLGRRHFEGSVKRVLVYGAGNAGQQLVASMRSEPAMAVCGYIDDDRRLDGQRLDGVRVYWSGHLAKVIERQKATDILLALPSISRQQRNAIVTEISKLPVYVKTLPQVSDMIDGNVSFSDIRDLDIEDLLGREPVAPNELLLGRTIVGKSVLVTGAGGSIGSELCRQIVRIGARRLVLYEISEFALYAIDKELDALKRQLGRESMEIVAALGSVTDAQRLAFIFERWQPDTVYHAAAYKHVPLVEANPVEGVRNNIIGTFEVVNAAHIADVSDFILISTDKAVRPTNVMGATKRGAEQILQAFADKPGRTKFSMVRFGNVLGSSGSVVPLFRQQIEAGGPVTVTHRDVTRYFMTIPEAAGLVIQAGGLAKGGEVFVLDMGDPVRIIDLARTMIQLSGLTVRDELNPTGDIAIAEVGLRPGEKLYEELLIGESPTPTKHERIMMAREQFLPWQELLALLQALRKCRDRDETIALLGQLVPEFEHRRDNDGDAVKAAS